MGDDVKANGFELGAVTTIPEPFDQTVVRFEEGHEREARKLAKDLGVGAVQPIDRQTQRLVRRRRRRRHRRAGPGQRLNGRARAAALFAVLFAGALVVTALVLASRTSNLVLEVTSQPEKFTPEGPGEPDEAEITFFVRESDPDAEVYIVGRNLRQTRTLEESIDLTADEEVTVVWDGEMDSGQMAPSGRYRLRVVLPNQDRDMVYPKRIRLANE